MSIQFCCELSNPASQKGRTTEYSSEPEEPVKDHGQDAESVEGSAAGVQHEKAVPEGVRRSIRRGYTEKEKGNSEAKESEKYCGKHQTHDIQQWQMRSRGQNLSQLTREPEI